MVRQLVDVHPKLTHIRAAPSYAVLTEGSAFPAGWVRFDVALNGYVFRALFSETGGSTVHADPRQAVPAWVGAHTLKAIHPIPENITGDMLAAAPSMLRLLKQVRALMDQGDILLPGLDSDYFDHILALAEGRS